ncbi:MAG: NADP-dependent oxidoreductase [Actinomycetota bacterium]|nr:NADP-dependent oxidoreductase [Actinomycetota bacterium]
MRAAAIEEFGGPEALRLADLPEPKVGPDYILIRARAAGVNPVDCKTRRGSLEDRFPHFFPLVPGWDVAGVVEQVGPVETGFSEGDEVVAYCRKDYVGAGTYAELVSVKAVQAAAKPPALSFEEAAALPLAGLTAFQALHEKLEIQAGETVLIHAASGGVGRFAVQLARLAGARVIGTARAANHDAVRDLGAAEVIDYSEQDVADVVRASHPAGVDAVLDLVGGEALERSPELLADGGRIASVSQPAENVRYLFVRPDSQQLAHLGSLADSGQLRVSLAETLSLEEAGRAHELLESGRVSGKLALSIAG